jgi:hypothetical protein
MATTVVADDGGFADVVHIGVNRHKKPFEVIMAAKRPDFERRWRGPGSNRRHHGFQPCALPTELPRLAAAV